MDLLASSGFDPELGGARLLARDAVKLRGIVAVRSVASRVPASLRRSLEDQMPRRAIALDDAVLQGRIHRLLAGFWDELKARELTAPLTLQ